jgi:salicylate hydroxylase
VRAALFGPERPRFTGCVAYRGLVPAERLKHLGLEVASNSWLGPGGHFVHYFVAGGRLVNFVAIMERESWTRESWTDRGEVADALAAFDGWHPQVRAIIGAVDETFIWALFVRAPLERWSVGRVTLLGVACHAMLPFMAQGPRNPSERRNARGLSARAALAASRALLRYGRYVCRVRRIAGDVARQQDSLPSADVGSTARARWGARRGRFGDPVALRARRLGHRARMV